MGQRGRPTARIVLSGDERETLERWARRRKTQQALARGAGSCALRRRGRRISTFCRRTTTGRHPKFNGTRDYPPPTALTTAPTRHRAPSPRW